MPIIILEVKRHQDERGWFCESWNEKRLRQQGIDALFCQDNRSYSARAHTLRGLHFQRMPHAQAKLVECLRGSIFDVVVDIRRKSPTFGQWMGIELSATAGKQLFVPQGYAHGFVTMEPDTVVAYKVDAHYHKESEGGILWNDAALAIEWPLTGVTPLLSEKDENLPAFCDFTDEFPYDGSPLHIRGISGR